MTSSARGTTSLARDADLVRVRESAAMPPHLAHGAPLLVQRSCACGGGPGVDGWCEACRRKRLAGVQTKLLVNRPGDRFEREAEHVALAIARGADPAAPPPSAPTERRPPRPRSTAMPITPLEPREAGLELRDDDPSTVDDRRPGTPREPGLAPSELGLAARVRALEGRGRPLDAATRAFFEQRLGRDLSAVRIHTSGEAGALTVAMSAKAFTFGRNVAFGAGRFAPSTAAGRSLLAHELTHTVQQGRARAEPFVQRAFAPLRGSRRVCPSPPSARRQGVAAHRAIQTKFLRQAGRGRRTELTLPFTDTSACTTVDRYEPPTSRGRVDLAIVERRRGKVSVRLGEIKPYNVNGMSAGVGVMECYERAIRRLHDVCVPGPVAMHGTRDAQAIQLCHRLNAFTGEGRGLELEVGRSIRWQPGTVTMRAGGVARAIGTVNLGGVIGYFCPEKLLEESRRAARRSARQAARKGGKGALKKLVPGMAYLEAGMFATVLLAGCKPTFGGDGVDLEEAFLHVLQHGSAPDVKIPDQLKQLLDENPELMERMRELERGEGDGDAAAGAMLGLLEANQDLVDAETLEFLVAAMEGSERSEVSRSGEEFRAALERIRAGAEPGIGEVTEAAEEREGQSAEPALDQAERLEADEPPDVTPDETAEPLEGAGASEEAESAPKASTSGRQAQRTVDERGSEPQRRLFEHIRDRVGIEGDEAFAKRFLEATQTLGEADVRAILEHLERQRPTTLEEVLQSIRDALATRPEGAGRLERLHRMLQDPTWQQPSFARLEKPLQFYIPGLLTGRQAGTAASGLLVLALSRDGQRAAGYVDLVINEILPAARKGGPRRVSVTFTAPQTLIDVNGNVFDLGIPQGRPRRLTVR